MDVIHVRLGMRLYLNVVTVTQLEMQLTPFISPQLANAYVCFFNKINHNL